MLKTPINFVQKCRKNVQNSSKKDRKVWYLFKNQEKRFDILLFVIGGNMCMVSLIPRNFRDFFKAIVMSDRIIKNVLGGG
jgi:hypothetical protein